MSHFVVVATREEVELVDHFPELKGQPVIITGVGGTNVIKALRNLPKDSWITNIGYAGSLDLPIGSFQEISRCKLHHDVDYLEEDFLLGRGVPCYTGTDFVTSSRTKGCVFDMELAFICALGFNVRAYKKVSDHCNYEEYERNIRK